MKAISNSKRNPKKALAFALTLPGMGQLYNGEVRKALIVYFTLYAGSFLILILGSGLETNFVNLIFVAFALTVMVLVYGAVDAYQTAKRIGTQYQLRRYNKVYIYIAIIIIGHVLPTFHGEYIKNHLLEAITITSMSMQPTLEAGDYIFIDKGFNKVSAKTKFKRGDVALFRKPGIENEFYIKRIIGLPNDEIRILGHEVFLNGVKITGEKVIDLGDDHLNELLYDNVAYQEKTSDNKTYTVIWNKNKLNAETQIIKVPEDSFYFLGDNRNNALDSRYLGPIPAKNVTGLAKIIYLSFTKETGLNPTRINKPIE